MQLRESGKPFYHSAFQKGLEKIAYAPALSDHQDVFGRLFSGKVKSLGATITAILEEIQLREKLDVHLIRRIEADISWQRVQFDHLDSLRVQYEFDMFCEIATQKKKHEDSMLELEKEKRKEYLECWRDLMSLKKYLMIALKEFWDFTRRRDLLVDSHENIAGDRGAM
jgi:hypothetical protein